MCRGCLGADLEVDERCLTATLGSISRGDSIMSPLTTPFVSPYLQQKAAMTEVMTYKIISCPTNYDNQNDCHHFLPGERNVINVPRNLIKQILVFTVHWKQ